MYIVVCMGGLVCDVCVVVWLWVGGCVHPAAFYGICPGVS